MLPDLTPSTSEDCATMKRLLARVTGIPWSVRKGTGTAGAWIHVTAPKARRHSVTESMALADASWLMDIFGIEHRGVMVNNVALNGISISPDDRREYMRMLYAYAHALGML